MLSHRRANDSFCSGRFGWLWRSALARRAASTSTPAPPPTPESLLPTPPLPTTPYSLLPTPSPPPTKMFIGFMAVTHIAISITLAAFFIGASPWVLTLVAIGALIPDLDSPESLFGRMLLPITKFIAARYAHRTLTHCLWTTVAIAIAALPLFYYYGWQYWSALPFGHLSSILADTLTVSGVSLFYPDTRIYVYGGNPKARIKTQSKAEFFVLGTMFLCFLFFVNIQSNGGLLMYVNSQVIGGTKGLETIYEKYGGSNEVWASIDGTFATSQQEASGEYLAIGRNGEFIVSNARDRVYGTNSNLAVRRMTAKEGKAITVRTESLLWQDEDFLNPLIALYQNNSNALIYITGRITIHAPEDIALLPRPEQYNALALNGSELTLDHCPVQWLGKIQYQYATGSAIAKILYPSPFAKVKQ